LNTWDIIDELNLRRNFTPRSTPIHRDDFLDLYPVNAFMRARPYATEASARLQQRVWETVCAIPSCDASALTYKTFLKYGKFDPVPQLWLLNTNKYDGLIKPIEDKLKSDGDKFKLELLARGPDAHVAGLKRNAAESREKT